MLITNNKTVVPTLTLVGVGGFGRAHLQAIRLMETEGLVRLASVIDPHKNTTPDTERFLRERNIPWYSTWEEYAASGQFSNCVALALPIHLHYEYAIKAYATGAYVYLEKPPVPLLAQMEDLLAMEGTDSRIQVGFTFPYGGLMTQLRQHLQDGKIGTIESYRLLACWPRNDAYYQRTRWAGQMTWHGKPVFDGPATNALAHKLQDLLLIESFLAGRTAIPEFVVGEIYRARPISSYDVCCGRGRFPSGADFSFALSHACRDTVDLRLIIHGSKGTAWIDRNSMGFSTDGKEEVSSSEDDAFILAYRHFVTTAARGLRPQIGLKETLPFVQLTNALLVSSDGIHEIPPSFQDRDESAGIYHVHDIEKFSVDCCQRGLNFSELPTPWGVATLPVRLDASLSVRATSHFGTSTASLVEKTENHAEATT